eukprot:TRINITY_DN3389_c0_g1_i10.p1 TRINITY_DN3389_c0_g1~~TRINITY_DN3389_c0_g1_i10.p1  ORF type:complete len:515 (+),score=79.64 TRINITY_DN3389_c0_g1_i10:64-1608(+)
MNRKFAFVILVLSSVLQGGFGFSIPGVSIQQFTDGQEIPVMVNELDSVETQLPFKYSEMKYCPAIKKEEVDENLGSLILGEVTESSGYRVIMNSKSDLVCQKVCQLDLTDKDVRDFRWMIDRNYRQNLVIDNLPAYVNRSGKHLIGVPIGFKKKGEYYLNNHLRFTIHVYPVTTGERPAFRIVGFEVEPFSLAYLLGENNHQTTYDLPCRSGGEVSHTLPHFPLQPGIVLYSYDVVFRQTTKPFASRWDVYKFLGNENIHWISLTFSLVINLILTSIITQILRNALRNDIRFYNELDKTDDVLDNVGWKQVQNDAFRPPRSPLLLSVLIGTGTQIVTMTGFLLLFTLIGFASETHRGSLVTTCIILYVFLGFVAGLVSARIYKMLQGVHWLWCTIFTAMFYPATCFIIFNIINLFLVAERSSGSVPFTVFVALIALWFGISAPLVFLGGLIGYKSPAITHPCHTNPVRLLDRRCHPIRVSSSSLSPHSSVLSASSFISSSRQCGIIISITFSHF